jgi:hypothetical protein
MRGLKASVVYFLLIFAVGGSWDRSGNSGRCPISVARRQCYRSRSLCWCNDCCSTLGHSTFHVSRTLPATISMGIVAIGLLLPAEIVGVHWVRGLSVQDYLTGFPTAPGVVSRLMFLLFAAMPTLVTRAGSVSRPNDTAEAEDL